MSKYTQEGINNLAEEMRYAKDAGRSFSLLFGAGCSLSSGIPLANGLVQEICETGKYNHFLKALDSSEKTDYGLCMRQLPLNSRRDLLTPYLDKAKINWAHIAIASMMKSGYIQRALTFNFDNILNRANGLCGEYPSIYDYATAASDSTDHIRTPCIIHLHGQGYGLSMLNSDKETGEHATRIEPLLRDTLDKSPLLVAGYSGEADKVFPKIAEAYQGKEKLHWCDYNTEPNNVVKNLLDNYQGVTHHYGEVDADIFFVQLAQELMCFPPKVFNKPLEHLRSEIEDVIPYRSNDDSTELDVLSVMNDKLDQYEHNSNHSMVSKNQDAYFELFLQGHFSSIIRDHDAGKEIPEHILYRAYIEEAFKIKGINTDELKETILIYEKAIKLKPDNFRAINNCAITLAKLAELTRDEKLFHKSIIKYEKAIELEPDLSEAFLNFGVALIGLASITDDIVDYENTINACKKSVSLDNNNFKALSVWGSALSGMAKLKRDKELYLQSISKFKKIIFHDSNDADTYINMGNAYVGLAKLTCEEKEFQQALINYKKALQLKSDNYIAYCNLASALISLADFSKNESYYNESITITKKAIKLKPNESEAYINFSGALSGLAGLKDKPELYKQAIKASKKAIELEPLNSTAYSQLGCTLINFSELTNDIVICNQAIEKCEKAITLNLKNAKAFSYLGNAYVHLSRLLKDYKVSKKAIDNYIKAIKLNPNDPRTYSNYGALLLDFARFTGEKSYYGEARKILEKSLILAPNETYNIACLESQLGNIAQCKEYLCKAFESGTLPSIMVMKNDEDLNLVKNFSWFKELLKKVS